MDNERLLRRLIATFVAELDDRLPSLERDLLAIEKTQDQSLRRELFTAASRTLHTLKGAAASVGAAPIISVTHRLEELLLAARVGTVPANAAFFDAVLPAVDAIADAGRRLGRGETLATAPIVETIRILGNPGSPPSIQSRSSRPPARPSALDHPSAPDLNIEKRDTVHSVQGETSAANNSLEPSSPPVAAFPVKGAEMLRISANKLDTLLSRSGELLTTRHRFDDRHAAAIELLLCATDLRRAWRDAEVDIATMLRIVREEGSQVTTRGLRSPRELDRMLGSCASLVSRLEQDAQRLTERLGMDCRALHQISAPLDEDIRSLRMQPFNTACEGLQRTVRELTVDDHKRAELTIEGGEVEVDRAIIDGMKEALLHLVRNAVDHGIEALEIRRRIGKPEVGSVVIKAELSGQRLMVTIRDNGGGIDTAAIRDRLLAMGKSVPENSRDLIRSILLPGFSTAKAVSIVSGRGVGLDIVAAKIAALRGTIDIESEWSVGTKIIISVPVTLTTIRAVLVRIGGQVFGVESSVVGRVVRIDRGDLKAIDGYDALLADGVPTPVVALADILGRAEAEPAKKVRPAISLSSNGRTLFFAVDEALAERELVVTSLGRRLRKIPCVTGASILSDGQVGLILDPASLIEAALRSGKRGGWDGANEGEALLRKKLLVVDDSLTVRMLEKSLLEAEGYEVVVAANGDEAWQLLLAGGADLVVSDVEMPGMDGIALTESIRASNKYRSLPVILVTGRESDADKARGMAVGANAYLPKSAFDQKELLATIAQIL
ncbi:MAG TPA: response regulator [Magnetospirillaceae bacterium]|jgi:two-component system chemotaxis sensor kinase CheA